MIGCCACSARRAVAISCWCSPGAPGSKHKTNRRDAARLSELLWLNRTRLLARLPVRGIRRVRIAAASEQQDRRVTTLRQQVQRELTRVTNRIKHLLRRHDLEQECPTKGIVTAAAGRWLDQLSLDALDRLELDHLRALAGTNGGLGRLIRAGSPVTAGPVVFPSAGR